MNSRPIGKPRPASAGKKSVDTRELIALFQAGRYAEVEQSARGLLTKHPQSGFLWKALGAALQLQGKPALDALKQAAAILTDDAEAHSNLGAALRDAGQPEAALKSHQRALRIRPAFPDALSNQGMALLDLGRVEDAIASLDRALKINPSHAMAWNNLGNALQGRRQPEQALVAYQHALALVPHYPEALNNQGRALRNLLRPQEAVDTYRRAIAIKPDYVEAHSNLGVVLQELGQFDAAIGSLRHALQLRPGHAEASFNLGRVLRVLGQMKEAEALCRASLEINARQPAALVLLGEFDADRGDFAQAEQHYRAAIEINPMQADAWSGIALARRMTIGDTAWFETIQNLLAHNPIPHEETGLRYALGKYFDDIGDYAQAFPQYRRANQLQKAAGKPYLPQQEVHDADRIVHLCNREWVRRKRRGASESARPVFIIGMPRSGTSLAEQILAAHPTVYGAGELPFWQGPAVTALLQDAEPADAAIAALASDYLGVLDGIAPGAARIIDKMPANYRYVGLIHAAFPNARFIHMQRNPADTCLSIYFQRFNVTHAYSNDLDDLAHCYGQYLRLMEHWRAILPEHRLLDLPYEELVAQPEAWTRRMLAFLDLPWDERCLRPHESGRTVSTLSNWQVRQKINQASVERWRHYEAEVGPLLHLLK